MKIDGIDHANDQPNHQAQKKFSYSTLLRFTTLLLNVTQVSAQVLSILNQADPAMQKPNYNLDMKHQASTLFKGLLNSTEPVLAGDHTVANRDRGTQNFMTKCFGFNQITEILLKSIPNPNELLALNYSQPPCTVTADIIYKNDEVDSTFRSQVYGLLSEHCTNYSSNYMQQANDCKNEYYDSSSFWIYALIVLGMIAAIVFLASGAAVSRSVGQTNTNYYRIRDPNQTSINAPATTNTSSKTMMQNV